MTIPIGGDDDTTAETTDLLAEFRQEAGESLDRTEQAFQGKGLPDAEAVSTAFRHIHTIKGNAGFVGLSHVVAAAHALEFTLDQARRGDRPIDRPLIDLVLNSIDALRHLIEGRRPALDPDTGTVVASDEPLTTIPPSEPAGGTRIGVVEPSGSRYKGGSGTSGSRTADDIRFIAWLDDCGMISPGETQRLLSAWFQCRPTQSEMMRDILGLSARQTMQVLSLASQRDIPPFHACSLLGYSNGMTHDQLESMRDAARIAVPVLLVETRIASAAQALRWMREFSQAYYGLLDAGRFRESSGNA